MGLGSKVAAWMTNSMNIGKGGGRGNSLGLDLGLGLGEDVEFPTQRQSVQALLRNAARVDEGKLPATVDVVSGAARTYGDVLLGAKQAAAALVALGASRGARVGVLSFNSALWMDLCFGLPMAGTLLVPLNYRLAAPELAEVLVDADVEFLVVEESFLPLVGELHGKLGPSFKGFLAVCSDADAFASAAAAAPAGVKLQSLPALMEAQGREAAAFEDRGGGGDDPYAICYTGGSTGKAKGVVLSHTSMTWNALAGQQINFFSRDTRYLHAAPTFHLADLQFIFGVTMAMGVHVFMPRFTPPGVVEAIEQHRVTMAVLVPVMLTMVLRVPAIKDADLSSLNLISYGGSPMSPAVLEEALAIFPEVRFVAGYGATECGPAVALLGPEHHVVGDPKINGQGRPVPMAEVKVVDKNDVEVPIGTVGEIVVRGPHTMLGYWRQPELTRKAYTNGWFHMGDGGYMDKEGYIFLRDRMKDMIVSGGENVYSAEVEKCLAGHPAVGLVCVIGTPDAKFGELVTAVIQPKADVANAAEELTLDSIRSFCKDRIAGYKHPRRVEVRDSLPISGAGKILKYKVREEFWKGAELQNTFAANDNVSDKYS